MKYILIIGASENGKSTTINQVCKDLKPTKAWQLNSEAVFIEVGVNVGMFNGTYLIEVNGVIILVAAGCPTEQDVTITDLVNIAISLGFVLGILLVAMRTFERKEDFDTPRELEKLGTKIDAIRIEKIAGDFKNNSKWIDRVQNIVSMVKKNI